MNSEELANMLRRWQLHCHGAATPAVQRDAFERIARGYGEPHRHYHTLAHVRACLELFDEVRALAHEPDTVESAIWLHDIVYEPGRTDNEQRSADVAVELLGRLGTSRAFRGAVQRMILATRYEASAPPPRDNDTRVLLDIDLSIFGRPPDVFDAYDRAIREEFAHVDEAAYRAARRRVLQNFLDRPRIYLTDPLRDRFEQRARENLRRAIERLS